jgi:hypothetical protein
VALTRCYDLVDTNLQLLDLLFCVEVPGLRCVNPNHLLGYIGMYNFEIIFGERERCLCHGCNCIMKSLLCNASSYPYCLSRHLVTNEACSHMLPNRYLPVYQPRTCECRGSETSLPHGRGTTDTTREIKGL